MRAASLLLLLLLTLSEAADTQTTALRGRVVDADGAPIASARVGVIDQQSAAMREIQTDSSGRFQIDSLIPGRQYRIAVSKFGYEAATLSNIVPGGNEIIIMLKPQKNRPAHLYQTQPKSARPPDISDMAASVELKAKLVVLNVFVKDAGDNPVLDLQRSNFAVYDDGAPQEIVHFEEINSPLSATLVVDTSSSMEGSPLREARRAALEFVNQSHRQNELALIAFNNRVRVALPFTQNHSQIRAAIDQLTATGGTALYDAIASAIELTKSANYPRQVIVLLSDGKDQDSSKRFDELERLVQSSNVVIFAVGEYAEEERKQFIAGNKYYKQPALEANLNPVWVLRRLADISGGEAFFPRAGERLEQFFSLIARELHHQYVIAYSPPIRSGEPTFHNIRVQVASAAHPGPLIVKTRKGYFD